MSRFKTSKNSPPSSGLLNNQPPDSNVNNYSKHFLRQKPTTRNQSTIVKQTIRLLFEKLKQKKKKQDKKVEQKTAKTKKKHIEKK